MLYPVLSNCQDLSQHQWNNRLLLVMGEQVNEAWEEQISVLKACREELQERKIIIYLLQPTQFAVLNESLDHVIWQPSGKLYTQFRKSNEAMEMVLIGLDGGIKLRRDHHVSCELLNAVIDQMPMRRAEIRKKGQ